MLELRVIYRDSAWAWRLRDRDVIEVWDGVTLVAELPGYLVRAILTEKLHHVRIDGELEKHTTKELHDSRTLADRLPRVRNLEPGSSARRRLR